MVDASLRPLLESEKLLGGFHFYIQHVQCLQDLVFKLNGKLIQCEGLQSFKLHDPFIIQYEDGTIKSQKLNAHVRKLETNWLADCQFCYIATTSLATEESFTYLHPVIENFLYTKAGHFKAGHISGLGVGITIHNMF